MATDTPFLEYLIIGAHTSIWLLLVVVFVFNIPLSVFLHPDTGLLIISLPFVYLLGMLFDSLIQQLLDPVRKRIRNNILGKGNYYKDEEMAHASGELYGAYEARMRRVRVIGAAIFNWPLLGMAILLNLGLADTYQLRFVVLASVSLFALSIFAWHDLNRRAYRFRKNASEAIVKLGTKPEPTK